MVQSERRASTTSRWPIRSTGLCAPVPCRRATMLPLRGLGPSTTTSLAGKPASRRRCAMASAATVVLPTESVVLISISCLKMSCDNCRVPGSTWASRAGAENTKATAARNKVFNRCRCIAALYQNTERPPDEWHQALLPVDVRCIGCTGSGTDRSVCATTPRIVAQEKFDPIYWSAHFQFAGKHPGDADA